MNFSFLISGAVPKPTINLTPYLTSYKIFRLNKKHHWESYSHKLYEDDRTSGGGTENTRTPYKLLGCGRF